MTESVDRHARTVLPIFSADETTDIGYELGTTVRPDYTSHSSRFNPDERFRVVHGPSVGTA